MLAGCWPDGVMLSGMHMVPRTFPLPLLHVCMLTWTGCKGSGMSWFYEHSESSSDGRGRYVFVVYV